MEIRIPLYDGRIRGRDFRFLQEQESKGKLTVLPRFDAERNVVCLDIQIHAEYDRRLTDRLNRIRSNLLDEYMLRPLKKQTLRHLWYPFTQADIQEVHRRAGDQTDEDLAALMARFRSTMELRSYWEHIVIIGAFLISLMALVNSVSDQQERQPSEIGLAVLFFALLCLLLGVVVFRGFLKTHRIIKELSAVVTMIEYELEERRQRK